MYTNDSINYCKPILIQVPEIFARFTRALLSQTFLVANQSLPYGFYNNMDINKASRPKIVCRELGSLYLVTHEMKSQVKVGLQYGNLVTVLYTIYIFYPNK